MGIVIAPARTATAAILTMMDRPLNIFRSGLRSPHLGDGSPSGSVALSHSHQAVIMAAPAIAMAISININPKINNIDIPPNDSLTHICYLSILHYKRYKKCPREWGRGYVLTTRGAQQKKGAKAPFFCGFAMRQTRT